MVARGAVSGLLNTVEIPSGLERPQSIANDAILTFIQINQSQKGDASQSDAMFWYPTDSPYATGLGLCNSLRQNNRCNHVWLFSAVPPFSTDKAYGISLANTWV